MALQSSNVGTEQTDFEASDTDLGSLHLSRPRQAAALMWGLKKPSCVSFGPHTPGTPLSWRCRCREALTEACAEPGVGAEAADGGVNPGLPQS